MNTTKTIFPPVVGALGAWAMQHWESLSILGSTILGVASFIYVGGCIHAKVLEIKERRLNLKRLESQTKDTP